MKKRWTAAYFPSDLLENQREKTIFCLLFDKVVYHFPISSMACGGGAGISDLYSDDILVQEGILELREDFLLSEIEYEFSHGHPWGTEEEFKIYHDLNTAGLALKYCEDHDAIPATGKFDSPIPLSIVKTFELSRFAAFQASSLGLQTLDIELPAIPVMHSEDIMKIREKLKDELGAFRSAMYRLAPKVRTGIGENVSIEDILRESQYIAETEIAPRVEELKKKIELDKSIYMRRIFKKVITGITEVALNWVSGGSIAALKDVARHSDSLSGDSIENDKLLKQLFANGELGYLVKCNDMIENICRTSRGRQPAH